MKYLALVLVAALGVPSVVFAQTCTPTTAPTTPLTSNQVISGATTCGGTVGLNLGGTVYPHPSKIYEFVAQNAAASITITPASADIEMSLVSGCTSAPLAIGFVGGPLVIAPATLTNGQKYFIVVTKDPSIPPQPAPGVCGTFGFAVAGTLPVSLQGFSVE